MRWVMDRVMRRVGARRGLAVLSAVMLLLATLFGTGIGTAAAAGRALGAWAPKFRRAAEGTRSTLAELQAGQDSSRRSFCEAKSSAEANQPSNR